MVKQRAGDDEIAAHFGISLLRFYVEFQTVFGLGAWESGRDAQLKTLVLQGKIDAPNVGAVSEEEAALLDEYRAYKALSPAEQHQERSRLSQALGWEPHWIKDWVWNEERQALVKSSPRRDLSPVRRLTSK